MGTPEPFKLRSQQLGCLPVVNHFLTSMRVAEQLGSYLPHDDARLRLAPAAVIAMVVRNIVAEHRPVYALAEWAGRYDPAVLGLAPGDAGALNDDRVGRMLDRLFDADRASLITSTVLAVIREFGVSTTQLHNDSTTVTVTGNYPDADGNTIDEITHVPTWDQLRALVGRPDFLYVADSKLCSQQAMRHIASNGGRFVTIVPHGRREDTWFRDWADPRAGLDPGPAGARRAQGRRRPRLANLPGPRPLNRRLPSDPGALQQQGRPRRRHPRRPHRGRARRGRRRRCPARQPENTDQDQGRRRTGRHHRPAGGRRQPLGRLHHHRDDRGRPPAGKAWPPRRPDPLPAHQQDGLHHRRRHPRRQGQLRRSHRRLLPDPSPTTPR